MADARYAFALPEGFGDLEAAPLLCAGLIGHRALRMTGDGQRLGLYGFGASAHIVCQVARHQGRRVFAFTRADDEASQAFALELGCEWAGDALGPAPEELDAAIIFAPVGALVPAALRAVGRGGVVVCAGIHMSDIPSFPYEILWGERVLRSVANLTRADAAEFLDLAPRVPVRTHVTTFALEEAEAALDAVRAGAIEGAAVVVPWRSSVMRLSAGVAHCIRGDAVSGGRGVSAPRSPASYRVVDPEAQAPTLAPGPSLLPANRRHAETQDPIP